MFAGEISEGLLGGGIGVYVGVSVGLIVVGIISTSGICVVGTCKGYGVYVGSCVRVGYGVYVGISVEVSVTKTLGLTDVDNGGNILPGNLEEEVTSVKMEEGRLEGITTGGLNKLLIKKEIAITQITIRLNWPSPNSIALLVIGVGCCKGSYLIEVVRL